MMKIRLACFLCAFFMFFIGCQTERSVSPPPTLGPQPTTQKTIKESELNKEFEEMKERFKFETKETTNEKGQNIFQAIIKTGGASIPKDLNDENIKKKIRPGSVESSYIESWILFLIPDPEFLKKVNLSELEEAFRSFGYSIKDQHLAVWITDEKGNPNILTMRYYCYEKFGLDFNHGPYIVITKQHPDERMKDEEYFKIKLYAIDFEQICWLLNNIAFVINENKIKTVDLFIDEKIALIKSHLKGIKMLESLVDTIFDKL